MIAVSGLSAALFSLQSVPGLYRPGYDPDACVARVSGRDLFIGSKRCMRRLPKGTISGYLTIGLEESCFTPRARDAGRVCNADVMIGSGRLRTINDGRRRTYRISAVVRGNGKRGLYGHLGTVPYGFYLVKLRSVRLVRIY